MTEEVINYQDKLIRFIINSDSRSIIIRSNKIVMYSELKEIMKLIYNRRQHQFNKLDSYNSDFRALTW